MKALVYRGPGTIAYETVPDPVPEDALGAVVRLVACGICGSDLHPYHVHPGHAGYCIGHEGVGEVVEVGSGVNGFRPGDRVMLPGSLGCGECAPCLAHNEVLCERFGVRIYGQGIPGVGGCQAEAVAVPLADRNLRLLPAGMSDEVGIMLTDNLATAWFAARMAGTRAGKSVAVIGLGSVGLQCVLSALAMGADRVFAIDLIARRRRAAEAMGAVAVESGDPLEAIRELTGGRGVDVVLDASGGPVTTPLAVDLVARGGAVSVVGVSERPQIAFPIETALRKNLSFFTGVCSVQGELPDLLAAIAEGRLPAAALESIVSHTMPLSQGAEAYRIFDAREDGVSKIVLRPGV